MVDDTSRALDARIAQCRRVRHSHSNWSTRMRTFTCTDGVFRLTRARHSTRCRAAACRACSVTARFPPGQRGTSAGSQRGSLRDPVAAIPKCTTGTRDRLEQGRKRHHRCAGFKDPRARVHLPRRPPVVARCIRTTGVGGIWPPDRCRSGCVFSLATEALHRYGGGRFPSTSVRWCGVERGSAAGIAEWKRGHPRDRRLVEGVRAGLDRLGVGAACVAQAP